MTDTGSNSATLEIKAMTTIHKKLHETTYVKNPNGKLVALDEVNSPFTYRFRKKAWYVLVSREMPQTPSDDHTVFTVSNKYDFLNHVYLTVRLPEIKVKNKKAIAIRLPQNPAHHILETIELRFNDTVIQSYNPESLDDYSHYFISGGKRNLYNRLIGNTFYYQNWSTILPSSEIGLPLPFFHSSNSHAIPLFYNSLTKVTFHCVFKKDISKLIMVKVKVQGKGGKITWQRTKFHQQFLEK